MKTYLSVPTETWKVNDKQTKLLGNTYKSYSYWPLMRIVSKTPEVARKLSGSKLKTSIEIIDGSI